MDDRKTVKEFINYVCGEIEIEYKEKGHNGFSYEFKNDKIAYLLADKGTEKRIEKQLFKRLGLISKVTYKMSESQFLYPNAILKVRLIKGGK
jgi:hypothetical protein